LEWKNDGVMDDKSGDDDTRTIRLGETMSFQPRMEETVGQVDNRSSIRG